MNLQFLSDQELLKATQSLVVKEREVLTSILHHLREIERRRLFCGCSSLFEYAIKKLGYSESQAQRRISTMRLIRDLPAVEDKIASGALNLTNASLAQKLFRQEKVTPEGKMEILERLEHKSSREAEKIVLELSSNPKPFFEKTKQVTPSLTEFRFAVDAELEEKIVKLKGLLAHKYPNLGLADLVGVLCDLGLEKWDPETKESRRDLKKEKAVAKRQTSAEAASVSAPSSETEGSVTSNCMPGENANSLAAPQVQLCQIAKKAGPVAPINKRPYLSAKTKALIWKRARYACETCKSQYALEIDHVIPVALGGSSEAGNLRLLCRHCNQRMAIEKLGTQKMEAYFS